MVAVEVENLVVLVVTLLEEVEVLVDCYIIHLIKLLLEKII